MRRYLYGRALLLAVMILSILAPSAARAMAQAGLQDDGAYVSPQFGYSITWGGDWSARERDVISNAGGFDTLTLRGTTGTLWIQGQGSGGTAADAVERRISIQGSEDDVVAMDLDAPVPTIEMLVRRDRVLIEGYELDGSIVVVVLTARERDFEAALASVHEQVRFNDAQILTGSMPGGEVADTGNGEDPVGLTEQTTGEASIPEPAEVESATAEATFQGSSGEDAAEGDVPEPQVSGDDNEDLEQGESGIHDGRFTSTLYDYSVEFDESIWTVADEFVSEDSDGLTLTNDLSWLTIWAWNGYGADASTCLEGEAAYYATEDPTVSEWEMALDANGDPLMEEGSDYAWGVYTLVFTDENGEAVDLVDYIECREIPGEDAVVIIITTAPRDVYNEHLSEVFEVADSIQIGSEEREPVIDDPATEEPVDPSNETSESGLSGSLFTSPSFDFTVEIPSQWRIEDELLDNDNEQLVLSNGTSDVVIWATADYQGDLAGCVDFAAEESGRDLELDTNAQGEPFRGEGRREAYGNFVYTSDDGEQMTYFISCMNIVDGESVLILTQDVPYDQFASQRRFRAELQDAIVIPE